MVEGQRGFIMLKVLLAMVLLVVPSVSVAADLTRVGFGDGRYYLYAAPPGFAAPPLVVALHGGGGSPEQFARSSGLAEVALREGFAIAFPAGTSGRGGPFLVWNAGYCCASAVTRGVDDVAFLDRVVADASARAGATGGAYMTGMSNGAMMAQVYAARRPERVVALATVAGVMDISDVRITDAVPFLHIHGTADDRVPYAGGPGGKLVDEIVFPSVEDLARAFLKPHGTVVRSRERLDAERDGTQVIRTEWAKGGRPVGVLLTVEGGGHVWPGSRRARGAGATREIEANAEVIRFFSAWR